ncbi:MAG: hypothetical protein M3350_08890 [Actinomycetota bacterium]|nr:hypothetical protein [Actinomycetota bacterium]
MIDTLLSPLRLPERALQALDRIVEDLGGLREDMAAELRPMRKHMAVMRESTSRLPGGIEKIEESVSGLGGRLDKVHEAVGNVHADMSGLNAQVEALGKQLATMQVTLEDMKVHVEQVIEDLPGASGTGVVSRVRDAIGGDSS